ncbi:helix-turn-helix domain-containing protein [Candidatus Lokiarchaeum ossiferum]|uniref:helix-turn-helix domain-containing protein n=1 Tax=Candidatus Lokiarchaeum ossiferum TaxID=2951803 RepID=UPI00352DC8D4
MSFFSKAIDQLTLKDVSTFLSSLNSESHRVDFKSTLKLTIIKEKYELLRDITSFANTWENSVIIYGVSNQGEILGMEENGTKTGDHFQSQISQLIGYNIQPSITQEVQHQPVYFNQKKPLNEDQNYHSLFLYIIRIRGKNNNIYSIVHKNQKIKEKFVKVFEIWHRVSGNKIQLDFTEIIDQIKGNNNQKAFNNALVTEAYNQLRKIVFLVPISNECSSINYYDPRIQYFYKFCLANDSTYINWLSLSSHIERMASNYIIDERIEDFQREKKILRFSFSSLSEELSDYAYALIIGRNGQVSSSLVAELNINGRTFKSKKIVYSKIDFLTSILSNLDKKHDLPLKDSQNFLDFSYRREELLKKIGKGEDLSSLFNDLTSYPAIVELFTFLNFSFVKDEQDVIIGMQFVDKEIKYLISNHSYSCSHQKTGELIQEYDFTELHLNLTFFKELVYRLNENVSHENLESYIAVYYEK